MPPGGERRRRTAPHDSRLAVARRAMVAGAVAYAVRGGLDAVFACGAFAAVWALLHPRDRRVAPPGDRADVAEDATSRFTRRLRRVTTAE